MTVFHDAPPLSAGEFELAARMSPSVVTAYLLATGWQPTRQLGRGELWTYVGSVTAGSLTRGSTEGAPGNDIEVLVTLDPELRDYPARTLDLVETLAVVERRSPAEVLGDMVAPSDTQYLALQPSTPSGSAPLEHVVSAVAGLRDAMFAAVASVLSPQAPLVQPPQRSQRARHFVERVRLGPTSAGSYVISVRTPLPSTDAPPQAELPLEGVPPPIPFERRVSWMLYEGTRTAHSAANAALERQDLTAFEEHGHEGVGLSANLCEALVDLGGRRHTPYQLSFHWSRTLLATTATPPLHFTAALIEVIAQGAEDLRRRMSEPGVTVRGTITRLHRVPTTGPGEITVLGAVLETRDPRPRSIRVHLSADDYSRANAAHDTGHPVEVQGNLVHHGTRKHLESVREFRVLPEEE